MDSMNDKAYWLMCALISLTTYIIDGATPGVSAVTIPNLVMLVLCAGQLIKSLKE